MATNIDKLRGMNQVDLAFFLYSDIGVCPPVNVHADCPYENCDCKSCWLNWLNSESEDE